MAKVKKVNIQGGVTKEVKEKLDRYADEKQVSTSSIVGDLVSKFVAKIK